MDEGRSHSQSAPGHILIVPPDWCPQPVITDSTQNSNTTSKNIQVAQSNRNMFAKYEKYTPNSERRRSHLKRPNSHLLRCPLSQSASTPQRAKTQEIRALIMALIVLPGNPCFHSAMSFCCHRVV